MYAWSASAISVALPRAHPMKSPAREASIVAGALPRSANIAAPQLSPLTWSPRNTIRPLYLRRGTAPQEYFVGAQCPHLFTRGRSALLKRGCSAPHAPRRWALIFIGGQVPLVKLEGAAPSVLGVCSGPCILGRRARGSAVPSYIGEQAHRPERAWGAAAGRVARRCRSHGKPPREKVVERCLGSRAGGFGGDRGRPG